MKIARICCPHCNHNIIVRERGDTVTDWQAREIFKETDKMFATMRAHFTKLSSLWKSKGA